MEGPFAPLEKWGRCWDEYYLGEQRVLSSNNHDNYATKKVIRSSPENTRGQEMLLQAQSFFFVKLLSKYPLFFGQSIIFLIWLLFSFPTSVCGSCTIGSEEMEGHRLLPRGRRRGATARCRHTRPSTTLLFKILLKYG